jgi:UPF0755 protein
MYYQPWLKRIFITTLILILLISLTWFGLLYRYLNRPMITSPHPAMVVTIAKSSTAADFANTLQQQKLIPSTGFLLKYIRWKGLATKLKAGVYVVVAGESVKQLLERVIVGDVLKKTFRIIEGTTQFQIEENLKNALFLNYHNKDWDILRQKFPNPEGMLLADTYVYDAGSNGEALIMHAHSNLNHYLEEVWSTRSPNLPYKSAYELLTAASILEKETRLAEERKIISGVIVNRLKKNMPLQVDPTVIYALGDSYTGKLTHHDMLFDSPYNTYRNRGLPPTPIAMVGKDAIYAAAHPAEHTYLYFVAMGNGAHHFSTTYEEQKKAVNRFLRKHDGTTR